jgi:hypothetical protein
MRSEPNYVFILLSRPHTIYSHFFRSTADYLDMNSPREHITQDQLRSQTDENLDVNAQCGHITHGQLSAFPFVCVSNYYSSQYCTNLSQELALTGP